MNTFFRALTAGFRADAVMFHACLCMSFTFFGTGGTDIGAELTKAVHIGAAHHHDLCGGTADGGAFEVQPDTGFQVFYFLFFKACRGALMAHSGTIDTCVDAGLIFCIRHIDRPQILFPVTADDGCPA